MPDRQPFEYGSGCSGPLVSVGDIPFLPICSFPTFTQPTLALHHVDMTLPDLAPPPLCPCIWTFKASPFDIKFTQIGANQASGSIWVVPVPPSFDRNCCEPTFNMSASLRLPCMPFTTNVYHSINIGKIEVLLGKANTCKLSLDIRISLPSGLASCIGFSVVNGAGVINVGTFSFKLSTVPASCKLKMNGKISLPATWVYVVDTVSFDGTNFKYHTKQLRVYAVNDGASTTWATAEPCPSTPP